MTWRETWREYLAGVDAHPGWGLWLALSYLAGVFTVLTVLAATGTIWGLSVYLLLAVRPAFALEQPGAGDS